MTSRDLNSGAWKPSTDRSSFGNRFMFTGREWIKELGIYDYRNRMYHPGLGRFLQVDPIGFDAGDMNLFRYCDDDPVNQTDPDGLFAGIVSRGSALSENWIGADGLSIDAHLQRDLSDRLAAGNLIMGGQYQNDGIPVTGGFTKLRTMQNAAVKKDYEQIDKSGIGGKDRPEYGGLSLMRKNAKGEIEYGYTGPYRGKQGRVEDKYRKMREANYLVVHGKGALPVPAGWTKIGWHYAHVIPGNTIPADDKTVARDYRYYVVGAAPPLRRGAYYNPNNPMIEYYPD